MNTTPTMRALGEFNIPIRAQEIADKISELGGQLFGTDSSAGKAFGEDPDAFKKIATGIGTLARRALGVQDSRPDAFNSESGASSDAVIHDPATLIAELTTVTKVSAGGGLETIGDVDEEYVPNYEGPAWRGGQPG